MNITLAQKHYEQARAFEQQQAKIALEVGDDVTPITAAHLPGDPRQLRGIPVVGVHGGLGGAIAGTRP